MTVAIGELSGAVLLISKRDGSVSRRFETIDEAAEFAGRPRLSLAESIARGALGAGEQFFRMERDWRGREVFRPGSYNRPVIVMACGRLQWFPCMAEAASALHVSVCALGAVIATGRARRDGLRARYAASTDEWPAIRRAVARTRQGVSA